MQIDIHMLEYQINIDVIICFHYTLELDYVRMRKLSKKHYLSVDSLRIS
jgi:hypothetical protein